MTVSSPCIGACLLPPGESRCVGCGRTMQEIATWGSLTEAQRIEIMQALPARLG